MEVIYICFISKYTYIFISEKLVSMEDIGILNGDLHDVTITISEKLVSMEAIINAILSPKRYVLFQKKLVSIEIKIILYLQTNIFNTFTRFYHLQRLIL